MLQQTTVPTVIDYFNRFTLKWPTLQDLAGAHLDDLLVEWQGLGYYTRAKNLKKSSELLAEAPFFPSDDEDLIKYPGIGDYTSKAIAAIAFNKSVVPIDGNVIRVFSRLFALNETLPNLKKDILTKTLEVGAGPKPGDFAQALMDLGSMVCRPQNPKCGVCPLESICQGQKIANTLPRRLPKTIKPTRLGNAYLHIQNDEIVLEKRGDKGLLANLWGVPTSNWDKESLDDNKPVITHVFTHFTLKLSVDLITKPITLAANQKWVKLSDLKDYALPTLMKKVIGVAKTSFDYRP